jgi:spermidine synthase
MTRLPALLLGGLATSIQILLLREFAAQFYGNEMTYGLVLACWLLWGGVGGLLGNRRAIKSGWIPFGYLGLVLIFPAGLAALRFSRFLLGILPGEFIGLGPALLFALALAWVTSLPLGFLFVANARRLDGDVSRVYVLESLGAAAAGLAVQFILVPYVSNWTAAAILGAAVAALTVLSFPRRTTTALAVAVWAGLAVFAFADRPSQRLEWRPFELVESRDTPYGKLQVVRAAEQITLYADKLKVYSVPDPAAAEEAVHFALLQRPAARRVLLVGGGAGGDLSQILKYPTTRVEYVELDPEIVRLSRKYLPDEERRSLDDPRVAIRVEDGRAYLDRASGSFDAVLLDLPEPATAQVNRFYTLEFFRRVRARLSPDGVFSFRVPSAENYISPELQDFLGTLRTTLRSVFPEVAVVPGDTNIFLASARPLTLDPDELGRRAEAAGLETATIRPVLLRARLSPTRRSYLDEALRNARPRINSDLRPISYFFSAVLWSQQFRGLEATLLESLARLRPFWLVGPPLFLFALALAVAWRRRGRPAVVLVPVAVMGLTSIVFEIAVILVFQVYYGCVYGRVALLLTAFMAGLAAGALAGRARKDASRLDLAACQGGFILLLGAFIPLAKQAPPAAVLFGLLFGFGFLGGFLFVAANRIYLASRGRLGTGYGLDLLGSFLGALAASSVLIPLAGTITVAACLILANAACFLFIVFGRIAVSGNRRG